MLPLDLLWICCCVETEFVVTTKTGSVSSAGTDSKVFITLNGEKKQIPKYQLHKVEGGKNPFEKDSKNVFKFNEVDVGKVRSIIAQTVHPCMCSILLAEIDHHRA